MLKTITLSLLAMPLLAAAALASDPAELAVRAELEREIKEAAAPLPKEITPGCASAPLSTTPTGPTWTADVDDSFLTTQNRFRMTAWRVACGTDDHQLLVTLTPITSTASVSNLFHVRQGGKGYNTLMVVNDALQPFSGSLSRPTTVMLSAVGGQSNQHDDDLALELQYLALLNPTVKLEIPAANATGGPPVNSFVLDGRARGTYTYADGRDGQGFLIDVDEPSKTLVGALFTGHATNTNQLDWFTFNGPITGDTAELTVFHTQNVRYGDTTPGTTQAAGTGRLSFDSCTRATLTIQIGSAPETTHTLNRLTSPPAGC